MSADPRLPELFAHATELEGTERESFIAGIGVEAPELARELRELLAAQPPTGFAADRPAWERLSESATPPERIGPYRIVRELGRGGMGRVYLAEESREAFSRTVALKIVDRADFGGKGLQRFRDEVRILASLEHPGIARFLDGGETAAGLWYLALEYVEGEDLLAHAARLDLDIEARVRLYLGVVEAVAYAHSRQVVHRDLKPANVIVGADGRPRLLDFGISKLIDPEIQVATLTRTELRAFTPAYASPEQIRGERAKAASDIFSLGVVLYELLAGVRPFGGDASTPAAVERAVLDDDPEPPSTAARRAGLGSAPRPASAGRRTGVPSADLDAICLKALRKDPADRYLTAAELARDLASFLAGTPVAARRGGLRYRIARKARRHRGAIIAALVAAAVATAAGFLIRRPVRAPPPPAPFPAALSGREDAATLTARFASSPENVDFGFALVTALIRESRAMEAESIVGRMRQIPGAAADPRVDFAEGLVAIQRDQPQRALALFARALDRAIASGRRDLVPRIRSAHARPLADLGRDAEARAELELARDEARAANDASTLASVLNDLAIRDLQAGRLAAGERLLRESLAAARASGDRSRPGSVLVNLGGVATQRGRPDLAVGYLRQAVELFRELSNRGRLAAATSELGAALDELGLRSEAAAEYETSLALYAETSDASGTAYTRYRIAEADVRGARLAVAESALAAIEETATSTGNLEPLACAELLRGQLRAARGDLPASRGHFAEARRLFVEIGADDAAADALVAAAMSMAAAGETKLAAEHAEAAAAPYRSAGESVFVFRADAVLSWVDAMEGRQEQAQRRLESLGDGEARPGVADRLLFLRARAAIRAGRGLPEEARRDLDVAIGLARAADRRIDELALRLDRATLDAKRPDPSEARLELAAIREEADRLGLAAITRRAAALEKSKN